MSDLTVDREVELLRAEYEHRFTEIMFHSARYHKQADYVQLFATVLLAGATFVIRSEVREGILNKFHDSSGALFLFLLLLVLATVIEFHLVSSLLDSLFMLFLNGARVATIETRLNALAERNVMVWDSRVIPFFFHPRRIHVSRWLRPDYLVGVWSCAIFLTILILLSFLSKMLIPLWSGYYITVVAIFGFLHIYQWIQLATTGVSFIHSHMEMLTLGNESASQRELKKLIAAAPSSRIEHWATAASVLIGCAVIAGIHTRPSKGIEALLLIVQFVVMLPILNFTLTRFSRRYLSIVRGRAKGLLTIMVVGVLMGVLWNAYLSAVPWGDIAGPETRLVLLILETVISTTFLIVCLSTERTSSNRNAEALNGLAALSAWAAVWSVRLCVQYRVRLEDFLHAPGDFAPVLVLGFTPAVMFAGAYFLRSLRTKSLARVLRGRAARATRK